MALGELDNFNPNQKKETSKYATYIPDRTTKSKFSIHKNIGHAKNALKDRTGILYELVDGEWTEIFRLDTYMPKLCKYCGEPYRDYRHERGSHYIHSRWVKGKLEIEYYAYDCEREAKKNG